MADCSVPTDFLDRDGVLPAVSFPKTDESAPRRTASIARSDHERVLSCQAHRQWNSPIKLRGAIRAPLFHKRPSRDDTRAGSSLINQSRSALFLGFAVP